MDKYEKKLEELDEGFNVHINHDSLRATLKKISN